MSDREVKVPVKTSANVPAPFGDFFDWHPFDALRRQMQGVLHDTPLRKGWGDFEPFDKFFAGLPTMPAVDLAEKDGVYELTAELPGLDEKNVEIKLANGTLVISGEKKDEREEKNKDYYVSERRYGSFKRAFRVPEGVDADKIEAAFAKGVLTVKLPKTAQARESEKKIDIKSA